MQLCHIHTFPVTLQVQTSHGARGRDQSTAGATVASEALHQLPGGLYAVGSMWVPWAWYTPIENQWKFHDPKMEVRYVHTIFQAIF